MNNKNQEIAPSPESSENSTAPELTDEKLFKKLSPGDKLKYSLIRTFVLIMGKVAAVAPEKLTYRICAGIALIAYKKVDSFRRIARENLEIAFGKEKTAEEIDAILRQSYINQGKNVAEFLMIPHKSSEWVLNRVKLDDPNNRLAAELEKGKGIIGLGAHIGSMELVCAWIGVNKFPMITVVKAQREELLTKFITETRKKWGTRMIFRAKGVRRECVRQLELNQLIGLVADQNAASNGVFIDFFGKKAATPTGAADIAMQTGAVVLPGFFATRNPDNTINVHVLDPVPIRNTGNRDEDLLQNVQACSTVIENFIRNHPTEYLWWHRRWKTRPEGETEELEIRS